MSENFASDIPESLQDADQILSRYGRWAMDRRRIRRCGSAEGQFRAPQDDEDRTPRELLMPNYEALGAQRALARVPDRERAVLVILYVPRPPWTVEAQLRVARIPARLCRERHLCGLRMFWNLYRGS